MADQNTDVGFSLDLIEEDIENGLIAHSERLVQAFVNEEYYACRNEQFILPRTSEDWIDFRNRPKRTSKITRKVIKKLCEHLYAPGPTRKLQGGGSASKVLEDIYEANHINAVMAQADRKATLNGCCLVGAEAIGDEKLKLYVWGAHEFVAYCPPGDPTEPWAIVTILRESKYADGRHKERLRYTAWSRDEHRVYLTEWRDAPSQNTVDYARTSFRQLFGQPATYQPEMSGWTDGVGTDNETRHAADNPYGCLPFVVISDETRVSSIYEGGIGDALTRCNGEIDRELSDLAAHTREFMDPDRFLRNTNPNFVREKNRNRWQHLPQAKGARDGDNNLDADAFLVQAQLAVEQVWMNIRSYADMVIEELDVPLATVRADASTDLSGVAIVGKQMALLQRTKQRQAEPFTHHESEVAKMCLCVWGNFYQRLDVATASETAKLTVIWPEPSFPLPTPERDDEDQRDLDAGRKSQVQVTAERYGVTTDEAKRILERVVEENQWYRDMLDRKGMAPAPEPVIEGNPEGPGEPFPEPDEPDETEL